MHSKYLFFIIVLSVLISLNSYVVIRGWNAIPQISGLRISYLIITISLFVIFILSIVFGRDLEPKVAKALSFVGNTYLIIFVYLFLSFLLVDFVRIVNYFFQFMPQAMPMFRLWSFVGSLGFIFLALIYGNYKFNNPEIVQLNISIDKPHSNRQLKIVGISDVHLGVAINKENLKRYVQLINEQQPDIVLMAGDISDNFVSPIINQNMSQEIQSIQSKYGVFAINGNHEYYGEKPTAMQEYLISCGVEVLSDSSVLVNNDIYIVGRKDRSDATRKPLSQLIQGIDNSKPIILLDHQPYDLNQAQESGIDFQFSGHTHNGQFFPGNLIVRMMYELGYGYKKKGNTHYYVSSGLGIWGPQYRIGTQSELVVINLNY